MMARRGLRVLAPGGLLVALFFVAPVAGAAPASDDDAKSQQATDLYKQGNVLYDRNDWAGAEKLYLKAWELKQTFDIASNLGAVELSRGKPREAAKHLTFALRSFPAGGKKTNRDNLEARLALARAQVGALHVEVNVTGAEVKVHDSVDSVVGTTPLADDLFVSPGADVTVRASAPGYEPALQSVQVAKGKSANVELTLRTWAEAEQEYLGKWKHEKTYEIASKLGTAQLAQTKYREAATPLAFAHRECPSKGTAAQCQQLEADLKIARAQVGILNISVNVAGARVSVEEGAEHEAVPAAEAEVYVDPGAVTVRAEKQGYEPDSQSVQVEKGTTAKVVLTLKEPRRALAPALALGGVGAAALAVGAAFIGVAQAKKSTAETLAAQTNHACPVSAAVQQGKCKDLESAAASGDTFGNTGIGLLVTAGVAAVGVTTYFLWPSSHAAPASGRAVRVVPVAGPSGGGVVVAGAF